jgi:hypothetical protein
VNSANEINSLHWVFFNKKNALFTVMNNAEKKSMDIYTAQEAARSCFPSPCVSNAKINETHEQ